MRMAMKWSVSASMLMVVGIVVLANLSAISAQFDCGGNLQDIGSSCGRFIAKEGPQIPPSEECCGVLTNVDFPCLCQKYIPELESQLSPEKTIYVGRTCNRPVPAGLKCGSYTVPLVSAPMPEE